MNQIKIDGQYDYFAFISYTEKDTKIAQWIKKVLTHYKFPKDIRDVRMDLPSWIRPVFEYKTDTGGGSLRGKDAEIDNALFNSKFLIVICSPHAVKSDPVNREIKNFIDWGREKYIIPFIIDGNPHSKNSEEECFPPALLELKGDRERKGIRIDNVNEDFAAVSVISTMFNLRVNDLWKPYEREKEIERKKLIETNNRISKYLARYVAEKACKLIDEGDSYTARLLALEILPTPDHPEFPLTPEAESALRKSLVMDNAILRGFDTGVICADISADNKKIVTVDVSRNIKIWDSSNGKLLNTIDELPEFYKIINKVKLVTGTVKKPFLSISHDSTEVILPAISLLCPPETDIWGKEHYFHCILEIRNLSNGAINKIIKFPDNHIILDMANYATFSPNGKNVLIATGRYTFFQWNIERNAVVRAFGNPRLVLGEIPFGVQFKPSKNEEAASYHMENQNDAIYSMCGHRDSVNYVTFSHNGKRIASASDDNTALIWSAVTGRVLCKLEGHSNDVFFIEFSPNGGHVLTVSKDGSAIVWSAKKGTIVTQFPSESTSTKVVGATFCSDGKSILAALSDYTIALWRVGSNRRMLRRLIGHTGQVNSIVCSVNGKWGVSASEDHSVRLWDLKSNRCKLTLHGHLKKVCSIDFSADGKFLVSSSFDETIRIWDTINWNTKNVFDLYDSNFCNMAISPDRGRILTAFRESVYLYDLSYHKIDNLVFESAVRSFNFSHNGESIVVSLDNGDIRVANIRESGIGYSFSLLEPRESPKEGLVYSAFSNNDQNVVAFAYEDGTVMINTLGRLYKFSQAIRYLLFSPDDKHLICACDDFTIKVLNVKEKRTVKILRGHYLNVSSLSFSPNGKYLLSTSLDGTAIIWDFDSGKPIETLEGHSNEILSAKFSPDGRLIATASSDCTIKLWDFLPLDELIQEVTEKCGDRKLTPEERDEYYLN